MSIKSVTPSNHLILCCPLLLLPSIFPSIRGFSNESALLIRWPKDWSFSFSISPSNEYSGLISFRMDWLDLVAVQGMLKSLLQHHSSKASLLRRSAFFMVQLSHPYVSAGKTVSLSLQTLVGKVMSLLLNPVSSSVIAFFPESKGLLISWVQLLSTGSVSFILKMMKLRQRRAVQCCTSSRDRTRMRTQVFMTLVSDRCVHSKLVVACPHAHVRPTSCLNSSAWTAW